MKIKTYELHFRQRRGNELDDIFRIVEAPSKAAAVRIGKAEEGQRNDGRIYFMSASEVKPEPRDTHER